MGAVFPKLYAVALKRAAGLPVSKLLHLPKSKVARGANFPELRVLRFGGVVRFPFARFTRLFL